ncbi:unnamed protein product [Brachionus calyciflorus]|uniref:Uncharacterized protein n=1 Tax=Brachionus calyciflorus TaxID=104777 RepID=A0A813P9A5_9BILA|nr:unnamed protein product [Brachionus calyciflorus]
MCLRVLEYGPVIREYFVNKPSINGVDKFLDYFVGTYFENQYNIKIWNHFETNSTPRTNNNLEGYNYKLNYWNIGISHPDIYKAIYKLKEEEVDLSFKYHKALNKEKPPPRNKLYVINDSMLINYKKMLMDGDLSIDMCVKYVCQMFDFSNMAMVKSGKS